MNQRRAARVRQQLAAQADQAARRNLEVQPHAPGAVVAHFGHFAAAPADGFHHDADEIFGNIDYQPLDGFELLAILRARHNFRLADHQFEAFAPHGLNEYRELQFPAPQNTE